MSEQDQVVLSIFLLFAIVGSIYWYTSKKRSKKIYGSGGGAPKQPPNQQDSK